MLVADSRSLLNFWNASFKKLFLSSYHSEIGNGAIALGERRGVEYLWDIFHTFFFIIANIFRRVFAINRIVLPMLFINRSDL